MIIGIL